MADSIGLTGLQISDDNRVTNSSNSPSRPTTPRSTRETSVHITPEQNLPRPPPSISDNSKKKLTRISPLGRRCVLTGSALALECAHVVPRATQGQKLRQLEFAWGLKPRSFNLDTSRNLIWLESTSHSLFDRGPHWGLLPSKQLLDEIFMHTSLNFTYPTQRLFTEAYPHQNRDYTFVQLQAREQSIALYGASGSISSEIHSPFRNFPLIHSHIHPYFVICNVAEKDLRLRPEAPSDNDGTYGYLEYDPELLARIRLCRTIYQMWIDRSLPRSWNLLTVPNSTAAGSTRSTRSTRSNRESGSQPPAQDPGSTRDRKRPRKDEDCPTGSNRHAEGACEVSRSAPSSSPLTPHESRLIGNEFGYQTSWSGNREISDWSKVQSWLDRIEVSTHPGDDLTLHTVQGATELS
ncbi:unnamed protein product [Rhizoctonia solani]|uniref:HNH nuclease domain-containing protein n=1 Tax=Rhizoctonia solani TaxID=456999 RepID=A0A8H3GRF6_9AGAM|nr:unnamed protein product [Rhizoctonia solani]